jgi:hypothetical protein
MSNLHNISRLIPILVFLCGIVPHAMSGEEKDSICYLGQVFILLQRSGNENIETEEYIPKGETPAGWSQLLSVQRLRRSAKLEELGSFMIAAVSERLGAKVTILQKGDQALVFRASIPGVKDRPAEEILGLLTTSQTNPGSLESLHYSQRPSMIEASIAELQLSRWLEMLNSQALRRNSVHSVPRQPGSS